jgi:peptide/nickel transport system substrate-binding protein
MKTFVCVLFLLLVITLSSALGLPRYAGGTTAGAEAKNAVVGLNTTMGIITIELFGNMPTTSGNFENLTQHGFYNGTIFHRVVHGFVIQGGDFTSKGITVPAIQDELPNKHSNIRGSVAMAKTAQANSASSQFYINLVDNLGLDSYYTVFGQVIEEMDTVDRIGSVATDSNDRPLQDVTILEALVAGSGVGSPARTLAIGTTDSVESCLDPARAYDYFGWEIIQSLGSGLVEYKPGATGSIDDIVPALATNWTVSSDGLVWTFNLRQGVLYEDNITEFNATNVKYTFDRGMGIADGDGPFVGIGYSDIINNVIATSKYVATFHLKIPFGPFLSLLACPVSYIVDPVYAPMPSNMSDPVSRSNAVVVYTEGNARASNPMGLGPYTLTNWTRIAGRDYEMALQANLNYWNASGGYPKTPKIVIKFYPSSSDLVLAIENHEIDVALRQLSIADTETMKNNASFKVWDGPDAFIQYLVLQEKYAPFNNTIIRQALAAAVNRTALVQTVFLGQAQNLYSMIPNGMFGHTDAFNVTLGDPNYNKTRELLAPLGYNETNKLTFKLWYETSGHYPQSAQQAAVIKSSLEASQVISVNLQGADWPSYHTHRRSEDMDAYIMGWYPDYIDPDDYIYPFLDSSGGSWLHDNYANPQMDQLIAWARGNTTASVRSSLYGQIQDLMAQDCPIIPLFQSSVYAVTSPGIAGVFLDMAQYLKYWLIYSKSPSIVVFSPENTLYSSNVINLNFTIDKPTSWVGYSLDGAANVTVTNNVTITVPADGFHFLAMYANGTDGYMGSSEIVYFSVDTTKPSIMSVSQKPSLQQTIGEDDEVVVNATIFDTVSGVKQATLVYSQINSSGSWNRTISMTYLADNTWSATIPAYPSGTNITYVILAEDNAGNTVATQDLGYSYHYIVISELSAIILPILVAATLVVAVISRKKRWVNQQAR